MVGRMYRGLGVGVRVSTDPVGNAGRDGVIVRYWVRVLGLVQAYILSVHRRLWPERVGGTRMTHKPGPRLEVLNGDVMNRRLTRKARDGSRLGGYNTRWRIDCRRAQWARSRGPYLRLTSADRSAECGDLLDTRG